MTLSRRMLWFWLGLLSFAALGFGAFWVSGGTTIYPTVLLVGLIVLTLVAALLAFALSNIPLGSGLLVGYALATVFSSGQCTFWSTAANYGFLAGAIYYIFALVGVLVLLAIVAVIEATRRL